MKKALLLAPVLLVTVVAHAESLEERQYWKGQMDYVQRSLDAANKSCGTKFSFDWVDKPKLRAEAEKASVSPYGVCVSIVDEVEGICREGDDERKSVSSKIKGFTCGYAKERNLSMSGGIVRYMGNNEQSNFSQWAKPWLLKNL
jgi:hypothetical protein